MLLMVGDGGGDGARGSLLRKLHKEVLRNLTGTGSGGEGVRGGKNFYQTEEMNLSRSTEKMGICACVFYVGGVGGVSGFLFPIITHQDYFTI